MRRRGFNLFRLRRWESVPDAPQSLQHAHELMASGDYPAAAVAFEELARRAQGSGGLRAPFLFVQAGRVRIRMGQTAVGVAHLKQGLSMLAKAGHYNQYYRIGTRAIQELKASGLEKEAHEISALVHSNRPAIAEMPTERPQAIENRCLPTHCLACGGPIRSDEVEWIDAVSAGCPFCGTPLRAG